MSGYTNSIEQLVYEALGNGVTADAILDATYQAIADYKAEYPDDEVVAGVTTSADEK